MVIVVAVDIDAVGFAGLEVAAEDLLCCGRSTTPSLSVKVLLEVPIVLKRASQAADAVQQVVICPISTRWMEIVMMRVAVVRMMRR